jgi:hypothetical protein
MNVTEEAEPRMRGLQANTMTFGGKQLSTTYMPCITSGVTVNLTLPSKTRGVLLHYDSSKHCTCSLNKLTQAFEFVKIFLKHHAFRTESEFSFLRTGRVLLLRNIYLLLLVLISGRVTPRA